jgi:ribosomal protein S12 methylthiotransferase accessory factor
MADGDGLTISDAATARSEVDTGADVLTRLRQIEEPTTGIIRGIRRVPVPADEPAIESYTVERAEFTPFTDGNAMAPREGGCGFTEEAALIATYGEAIERYCGCIFRENDLHTASYDELAAPAIDPTTVVNFSAQQRESMPTDDRLCGPDDDIAWVAGENLDSGTETYVPAQLVYLSYPPEAEPFIRNPISTGLAAGSSRAMAVRNGLCELVERDAFMTYYLTETELPIIDVDTAPPRIRRLAERVTAHGFGLTLLDATTDLGIPVVIAVLIDRDSQPAVTVAAASDPDANAAIESALEEVIQTRLAGIHRVDSTDRQPADIDPEAITTYADRGLFWSANERVDDIEFWIESSRTTTVEEFAANDRTDQRGDSQSVVERVTAAGYDCYTVDVTTRDIAGLGFTVQRVIAPRLQPLYLIERLRYFGGDRLFETPVETGYRDTPPTETELNEVPHPFP